MPPSGPASGMPRPSIVGWCLPSKGTPSVTTSRLPLSTSIVRAGSEVSIGNSYDLQETRQVPDVTFRINNSSPVTVVVRRECNHVVPRTTMPWKPRDLE